MQLQSAPGQGSTFSFQLRLGLAAEPESRLPPAPAQTNAQRTLIVDDNDIARDLLAAMASTLGWQVDAAQSGAQAVALLQERVRNGQTYDVIFVDWQMPEMDGWQTNDRMRDVVASVPGLAMPMVFMVTAHGREMLAQRAAQEQAKLNGFLVKPVTASMLLDAVMDGKSAAMTAATGRNPVATTKRDLPKRLQGMRILVVEDNKINQAVAHGLLSQEGAIVALADNGRLGVDAIVAMQPDYDVVLMDLQMPVMDGFEATRVIRQTHDAKRLPIIAMTANAMASDREACLAVGMDDHVGKPFELDHLVATLQKHTGFVATSEKTVAIAATPALPQVHAAGDLDMEGALARVGGNSQMYSTVLLAFAADMVQVPDQLQTHLAADETQQAARVLHTLKGLAATVGARHLAQVAAQLENQVKESPAAHEHGVLVATLRNAIDALADTLVPVLDKFQEGRRKTAADATVLLTTDHVQLTHDLQTLMHLLQASDMVAMEAFAMVDQKFGASLGDTLEPLRNAMNSLDFASAAAHCQTLLQTKA
jgi:CheY-like chemotaxis protein/HPt (histidine-containing phosphotransfer) domain-containing protein